MTEYSVEALKTVDSALGNYAEHSIRQRKIKLNDALKAVNKSYAVSRNLSGDDYLFGSKKGGRIGWVQAYRVLKEATDAVGIEHFGTHTMRKTWGYWTYKSICIVLSFEKFYSFLNVILHL